MNKNNEYKTKAGTIIKVGDLFNGRFPKAKGGAFVAKIEKTYSRWRVTVQGFDGHQTNWNACDFDYYGFTKLS